MCYEIGEPLFVLDLKTEFKEMQKLVIKEEVMYEILKASRRVKSEQELALLRFICESTNECHVEMMKNIKLKSAGKKVCESRQIKKKVFDYFEVIQIIIII